MAIKVLIADDQAILRAGLRALLNSTQGFHVVGEATTGEEAVRLAARLQPDVVLMEISMPGLGGIEATRMLARQFPHVRVVLLTIHQDAALLREAIRAGAAGYVIKRAVESELISAIRSAAAGDLYIHPTMTRALFDSPETAPGGKRPVADLTPREIEVLRLIAQGHTNRQIADLLGLSTRTIESHRANLKAKLNLRSRAELVHYAAEHGLLRKNQP